MKKSLFILGAGLLFSSASNAEFIETDWLVEGDKNATFDTVSGLEWLDLTETKGYSLQQAKDAIVSGELSGWRLPTEAEMVELVTNLFPSTANIYGGWHGIASEEHLFYRNVFVDGDTAGYSYGLFQHDDGDMSLMGTYISSLLAGVGFAKGNHNNTEFTGRADSGVWLVSDGGTTLTSKLDPTMDGYRSTASVPLSSTGFLLSLPILLVGLRKKARKNK